MTLKEKVEVIKALEKELSQYGYNPRAIIRRNTVVARDREVTVELNKEIKDYLRNLYEKGR